MYCFSFFKNNCSICPGVANEVPLYKIPHDTFLGMVHVFGLTSDVVTLNVCFILIDFLGRYIWALIGLTYEIILLSSYAQNNTLKTMVTYLAQSGLICIFSIFHSMRLLHTR